MCSDLSHRRPQLKKECTWLFVKHDQSRGFGQYRSATVSTRQIVSEGVRCKGNVDVMF